MQPCECSSVVWKQSMQPNNKGGMQRKKNKKEESECNDTKKEKIVCIKGD